MIQQPRGFGFVKMTNGNEVANAIQGLNGQGLNGRALNVNEARLKESRGFGGQAQSRGYGRRENRW